MQLSNNRFARACLAGVLTAVLVGCAATETAAVVDTAATETAIRAAVDSPERFAKDREKDADRRPFDVMKFAGAAPGQKVIDMFSAGGWYAELLARTVGPTGQVYMQNPTNARMAEKAAAERLADNRLPNVVRWDKLINEMDLPPAYFDGAMLNLVYHDFYTLSDDVDDVLADLYAGLKPGAWLVVVDHSAPAGTGKSFATDPRGAHRIDEAFAKESFTKAGFVLEAESDLMRNPADDRQKAFFAPEMKGKTTDKFILRFRKPG